MHTLCAKIEHRKLKKVSQKSKLSVQPGIFNQKLNNDPGNCTQEFQVIELSELNLKLNLNLSGAEGNKKNPETVIMHKNGQDIESSNSRKENIKLLTDERSQKLGSNYSEENYCGF